MYKYLYVAGKGLTILTGFVLFTHSSFMPTMNKEYCSFSSFFKQNIKDMGDDKSSEFIDSTT